VFVFRVSLVAHLALSLWLDPYSLYDDLVEDTSSSVAIRRSSRTKKAIVSISVSTMTRSIVVFAMLWSLVAGASPDLHDSCKGWADSGGPCCGVDYILKENQTKPRTHIIVVHPFRLLFVIASFCFYRYCVLMTPGMEHHTTTATFFFCPTDRTLDGWERIAPRPAKTRLIKPSRI
jgi:hypothetical protein